VRISRSLDFLDLELPGGHQAAANPPDSLSIPGQEPFGVHAGAPNFERYDGKFNPVTGNGGLEIRVLTRE
jgi:hypothetical protein